MSHTFETIADTDCTFMHEASSTMNTFSPANFMLLPVQSGDILNRTQREVYADTA